jgi:hypothetical protein
MARGKVQGIFWMSSAMLYSAAGTHILPNAIHYPGPWAEESILMGATLVGAGFASVFVAVGQGFRKRSVLAQFRESSSVDAESEAAQDRTVWRLQRFVRSGFGDSPKRTSFRSFISSLALVSLFSRFFAASDSLP